MTNEQKQKAVDTVMVLKQIADAIYEAIKESGEQGIPSGHLYAMLMGKIQLSTYQLIIDALKRAGKVTESNFLLKATKGK